MKKALITGITGQDGSYLAEFLLSKGYEVHGIVRRVALEDPQNRMSRISNILDKVILHPGSVDNYARIIHVFNKVKPDECYHLAAQSFVHESFEDGFSTLNININGTHNILSALREIVPNCRFYFAGSSEMFGKVQQTPQTEETKFYPRSPYGISKVTGYELARNYKESYDVFACSGILFNHESPRRGMEFVTRKITNAAAKIKLGLQKELFLGNLDSRRDWGFAGDYVEAMWLMLQQEKPENFVIATGKTYSVKEFVEKAFSFLELDWQKYVKQDPRFMRPAEVDLLVGDYSKAKEKLNWSPKISLDELIKMMVENDLRINSKNGGGIF